MLEGLLHYLTKSLLYPRWQFSSPMFPQGPWGSQIHEAAGGHLDRASILTRAPARNTYVNKKTVSASHSSPLSHLGAHSSKAGLSCAYLGTVRFKRQKDPGTTHTDFRTGEVRKLPQWWSKECMAAASGKGCWDSHMAKQNKFTY